jgi:hypothetical protein
LDFWCYCIVFIRAQNKIPNKYDSSAVINKGIYQNIYISALMHMTSIAT